MKRHHMVPFLENPQFTGGYLFNVITLKSKKNVLYKLGVYIFA